MSYTVLISWHMADVQNQLIQHGQAEMQVNFNTFAKKSQIVYNLVNSLVKK